jgi:hypothetical protein
MPMAQNIQCFKYKPIPIGFSSVNAREALTLNG